jgi:predicted membrane channel-forming protein YqfA (hemolysin III family)
MPASKADTGGDGGSAMKWMFSYSDQERRANIAAVNLFFSALLGASLGSMVSLSKYDFTMTIILLTGAVTSIFTIAFTDRRRMMVMTGAMLAFMLACMSYLPNFPMHENMQRLTIALLIWLVTLLAVRFAPSALEEPGKKKHSPPQIEEPEVSFPSS